jgi:hypothetical protein
MALDLNQSFDSAKSKINSMKTFVETSNAAKSLKRSAGNSLSKGTPQLASSLDKIATQQKRYLRNPPNSFDQLLELINLTNGSGLNSVEYLRKKLLEATVKIGPEVRKIISQEAIKALGCSQEQTFKGFKASDLQLTPLSTLPVGQGIYVPVQSLDIGSLLKTSVDSKTGQILYEKPEPTAETGVFRPYFGLDPYPMNKQLNLRMDGPNAGQTYYEEYQKYYQGTSGQDLFDFQFSRTNGFGVTQDCYRVALIDKVLSATTITGGASAGAAANKVGEFLNDYYSTINLVDDVDFAAALMNQLSGAINIQSNLSTEETANQTQFEIILQRILGLCFDKRSEIDVSGVSKVAELDGVDESFFEMSEVDLRNIEIRVNNVQNGVVEFVDCGNVKLPVDYNTINNELVKLRDTISGQTTEARVKSIEKLIDSFYNNPDWKYLLPNNVDVKVAVNTEVLKRIPLALASTVISPKVLFPIFVLLQVVENKAKNTYNQAITSGNTYIQSGNTALGGVNNIVNNQIDFLKTFKSFNIEVVSKIGAIYLKELYAILKKDILILVSEIIKDLEKSQITKKYAMILKLVNILLIVSQLVQDYRKCKSLVDDILLLLNQISNLTGVSIPTPLLLLAGALPGTSPERSTINTIELLQSVGIPTGVLPDGSPNLMGVFNFMSHKGADQENSENGQTQISVIVPPLTGGLLKGFGKHF